MEEEKSNNENIIQLNHNSIVKYENGVKNNTENKILVQVISHPLFNGSKFSLHNVKQKNN